MKLTKGKVLGILAGVMVLAFAFWYGGSAPGLQGWSGTATPPSTSVSPVIGDSTPAPAVSPTPDITESPTPQETIAPTETAVPTETASPVVPSDTAEPIPPTPTPDTQPTTSVLHAQKGGMETDPETGKDKYLTNPVPEGKPLPMEPQDAVITDVAKTCTLSIRCDTILDHLDWLDPEKTELVPEDGVIFPETEVTFYEGESVFNLLQREMKKAKIHMEFENTPLYNSVYIEGIHNLYEFDCGELSGWIYKVNGWFPNYGCSRYGLQEGDVVEWVYTCDLGNDVGGGWAATGG